MRWALVLFLLLGLTACGRLEFGGTADAAALDGAGDSAAGDATLGLAPELVQATAFKTAGASSVAVIDLATPTRASSLLVVATLSIAVGAVGPPVDSITDNQGNTYVTANALSRWTAPEGVIEIWSAKDVAAGTTRIMVSSGSTVRATWVLELANMDRVTPLDAVATLSDGLTMGAPSAPKVTPTRFPSVIVSVMLITGVATGLNSGSMFNELTSLDGDAAAYAIIDAPGTFGAAWVAPGSDNFGSSTAAFAAALP